MVRDVRMRGFADRADLEEVEAFLDEHVRALPSESTPLLDCCERVLSEPIKSEVDVPSFPRSAMDGYALRGEETFGASDYDAIRFDVIGTSLPGAPFLNPVAPGQAVRIMTGAPVPQGADVVVMAEVCEESEECGDAKSKREEDNVLKRALVGVGVGFRL